MKFIRWEHVAVAVNVREAIWPGNKSFQRVGASGGMIKEVYVI
jgi:hypothetical protein